MAGVNLHQFEGIIDGLLIEAQACTTNEDESPPLNRRNQIIADPFTVSRDVDHWYLSIW